MLVANSHRACHSIMIATSSNLVKHSAGKPLQQHTTEAAATHLPIHTDMHAHTHTLYTIYI